MTTVPCIALAPGVRSALPVGIVHPQLRASWGLESQVQVRVTYGKRSLVVWLCATSDFPEERFETGSHGRPVIWLSRRARDLLAAPQQADVTVELPRVKRLPVENALVDDLPQANTVDVPPDLKAAFGGRGGWAVLVHEGFPMPVHLRVRKMTGLKIRMAMLTRTLLATGGGVSEGPKKKRPPDRKRGSTSRAHSGQALQLDEVLLCQMLSDRLPLRVRLKRKSRIAKRWGVLAGLASVGVRGVTYAIERCLRALLLAPAFAFRTGEALVGDDTNQVVRLPNAAFPLLGVRPGDQVVLEWAGRQAVATALEAAEVPESEARKLLGLQRVDLHSRELGSEGLQHLTIGVAAGIRYDLGIPRHTVVRVRRRLATLVVGRLNDLTIPVGGLLLAGLTINGIARKWIAIGILLVTVMSMLPLLYNRPPRGRWP